MLRGVSHLLAVFIAAPAVVALWAGAEGFAAQLGALVFGTSLVALFAISAFYHRPTWGARSRDLVGRLDQSAIFILIAGTYTPFGLLLNPESSHLLLALIWASALGGVLLSLTWPGAPKPFMAAIYVLFGWVFVTFAPSLLRTVGPAVLVLIVLGGAFLHRWGGRLRPSAAEPVSPGVRVPRSVPPLCGGRGRAPLRGRVNDPVLPRLTSPANR